MLLPANSKWPNSFHDIVKCLSFNMCFFSLCDLLWIKWGFMIFANIFWFYLTKCPNFFRIAHLTCKCRLKLPSCHILIMIEINAFYFFKSTFIFSYQYSKLDRSGVSILSVLTVGWAWNPMTPQETGEASLWKAPDIFPWNWFQSVSRWQTSYPTEQAWHSGTQIGCKLVTRGYRDSAVWWTEQELSTRNLYLQKLCIWQ